jgi:hypothetical protein
VFFDILEEVGEGYLLPSLERLEASVEEDKTAEAECGDALAEPLPRVS